MASKFAKMQAADLTAAESIGAKGPRLAATPAAIPGHLARLRSAEFEVRSVPLDLIEPDPGQPRKVFTAAELAELADSIRSAGQLQAGLAYHHAATGKYRLICGERRFRALPLAGLDRMDLRIYPVPPTMRDIRKYQRIENLQRKGLDPIEQALDYRRALDEDGLSMAELAAEVGVKKGAIAKSVALVKLPQEIRDHISADRITPRAGYALSRLPTPKALEVAEWAVSDRVHAAEVEAEVNRILNPPKPAPAPEPWRSWPTTCIPLRALSTTQLNALNAAGVVGLGDLADRLDGAGLAGLKPADYEALRVILAEVKTRTGPDQRSIVIDPMAAASRPGGLLVAKSDPSGIIAEAHRINAAAELAEVLDGATDGEWAEAIAAADAAHPIDRHIDRVDRLAESGDLAPRAVSPGNDRPRPEAIAPTGPVEAGGDSAVYTFNPGDGRVGSVMLPADEATGADLIRFLEGMLRGSRLAVGPASLFPVGSPVVIHKKGSTWDRHRGVVERYEDSGESAWVRLEAGKMAPGIDVFGPESLRRAEA